mmetsp:Transcript_32102/g.43825  ORF Transcript_32102/g.43825 Transcript_32102/m.43825 type:complete len:84 (-) Transcript_32102:747-998(-)
MKESTSPHHKAFQFNHCTFFSSVPTYIYLPTFVLYIISIFRIYLPERPHGAIVTSSSLAVGWIAIQLSRSALVAPIFNATAKP